MIFHMVFRMGTWEFLSEGDQTEKLYTSQKVAEKGLGTPLPIDLSWLECSHYQCGYFEVRIYLSFYLFCQGGTLPPAPTPPNQYSHAQSS